MRQRPIRIMATLARGFARFVPFVLGLPPCVDGKRRQAAAPEPAGPGPRESTA